MCSGKLGGSARTVTQSTAHVTGPYIGTLSEVNYLESHNEYKPNHDIWTQSKYVNKDGSAVPKKKITFTDQETVMSQYILSIYLSANAMCVGHVGSSTWR